jgi:hypothetical protein
MLWKARLVAEYAGGLVAALRPLSLDSSELDAILCKQEGSQNSWAMNRLASARPAVSLNVAVLGKTLYGVVG